MRRNILGLVALVWCWTTVTAVSKANNNLFLPGDAFFPTTLSADDVERLKADPEDPFVFAYSSLGGYDSAFCGYAGYARARIPGLDAAFVANLKSAYARVREFEKRQLIEVEENGVKKLVETNPVRVLFYPPEFKFPKFRLGLQYNENWVEEAVKFGHEQQMLRLCCLVDDADAVMECWRDATAVGALKATLPEVELRPVPEVDAPVVIRGEVQAIVLNSRPLVDYFRAEEEGAMALVVDASGIREWNIEDGDWTKLAEHAAADVSRWTTELAGEDPRRAALAAEKLGEQHEATEAAILELIAALGDVRVAEDNPAPAPDRVVADYASAALAEIGTPATVQLELALGVEKKARTRRRIVETLKAIGKAASEAAGKLEEVAESDPVEEIRYAALAALGSVYGPSEELVGSARGGLDDKSPGVRGLSARLLGRCGASAAPAVGDLIGVLADEEERWEWMTPDMAARRAVRGDAAEALGLVGPTAKAAIEPLRRMMDNDPEGRVRAAAALALAQIDERDDSGLRKLMAMLAEDEDRGGRIAAAESLEALGAKAKPALGSLADCLEDENEYLRLKAVDAIAAIGGEESISLLRPALEDDNEEVRDAAAASLQKLQ